MMILSTMRYQLLLLLCIEFSVISRCDIKHPRDDVENDESIDEFGLFKESNVKRSLPKSELPIEALDTEYVRRLRVKLKPLFNIAARRDGSIDACTYVRGVTSLEGKVYVICATPAIMKIFDDEIYNEIGEIELPGSKNVYDVASCSKTGSIYLMEGKKNEDIVNVWKASVINVQTLQWTLWKTGQFWARSLWISSSCNVVLLTATTLKVLDQQGGMIRNIHLPSDVRNPRHAVETSEGNYIICHGWNDREHGVAVINAAGKVLKVYGGSSAEPQPLEEKLNLPSHLAIDEEGRVFIADNVNYRVLLLTHDLQAARILLDGNEDGVVWPSRLSYDVSKQKLYVGLSSGNPRISSVIVFKIADKSVN